MGEEEEEDFGEPETPEKEDEVTDDVQISMHALASCNSSRTMHLRGKLKGRVIIILIDFIEPGIAKYSGFPIQSTPDLSVAVADGTRLCSKAVCKNLGWEMQGITFSAEVRLLSLGCDMVLVSNG